MAVFQVSTTELSEVRVKSQVTSYWPAIGSRTKTWRPPSAFRVASLGSVVWPAFKSKSYVKSNWPLDFVIREVFSIFLRNSLVAQFSIGQLRQDRDRDRGSLAVYFFKLRFRFKMKRRRNKIFFPKRKVATHCMFPRAS